MKREEYKRDLWQEYVENADYIERVWKEGVIDFGENFLNGNLRPADQVQKQIQRPVEIIQLALVLLRHYANNP